MKVAVSALCAGILFAAPGAHRQEPPPSVFPQEMSAADAYHSKLFDGMGDGRNIIETGVSLSVHELPVSVSNDLGTWQELVQRAACTADAVLRGTTEAARSMPTADSQFLFTTTTLTAVTWLRAPVLTSWRRSDTIDLVRPGGRVLVDGAVVEARHDSYTPMAPAKPYYVLADYIDQTGAFRSLRTLGSFSLDGGIVMSHGKVLHDAFADGLRIDDFEMAIRAARCDLGLRGDAALPVPLSG
jgi:hypothetical protein